MAEAQENESSSSSQIVYIGDDESYWSTVTKRYKKDYENTAFEFEQLEIGKDKVEYQKVFIKILNSVPDIIYIDFSHDRVQGKALASLLSRENKLKESVIVGLVDKVEYMRECAATGISLLHIKCAEYHDIVYDPVRIKLPKLVDKAPFALAKFSKDVSLFEDFKIGYISPTYIHAEGNCFVEKGQLIEVETEISKKELPSNKYIVKEVYSSNLYYDYRYAFDIEFKYVDEPTEEKQEDDEAKDAADEKEDAAKKAVKKLKKKDLTFKQKMALYESDLVNSKKKVRQWVLSNIDPVFEKKTKILVVDPKLEFFSEAEEPVKSNKFALRFQSILTQELHEIDMLRPNIIAFEVKEYIGPETPEAGDTENKDESDSKAENTSNKSSDNQLSESEIQVLKDQETESLNTLSEIIQKIKSIEKYSPFLILFNCTKFSSKSFQDSFEYPLVITNRDKINIKLITDMANLYQTKQDAKTKELIDNKIKVLKKEDPQKYAKLTVDDFNENRYVVKNSNSLSNAAMKHDITIVSMSESELSFETDVFLEPGIYRLNWPVGMGITLVGDKETGKLFQENSGKKLYDALIHSVGEDEKKIIRQQVNDVFFADLKAQREKEAQEYAELTKKVAEEKAAAEKAAKEEAEKGDEGQEGQELQELQEQKA